MSLLRTSVGAMFAAFLVWGCSGDILTNVSVAGKWNLAKFNGVVPPATLQDSGGTKIVVQSDQITLNADGSWIEVVVELQTTSGFTSTVALTPSGYYLLIDNTITLQYGNGTEAIADIDGNTMTFNDGSSSQVYTRQ